MSDTVATCLLDLTNVSVGTVDLVKGSDTVPFGAQSVFPVESPSHTFHDLERSLQESAASSNEPLMRSAIARANEIAQEPQCKTQVLRILWKAVLDAKPPLADLVMSCPPFSFDFVDDINGRTYLHEAAISGRPRLAVICMQNGIEVDRQDAYGRTALHYAAIHGHDQVCECLSEHASSLPDLNAFIPLVYAVSIGHVKCVRALLTRQIETRNLDRHPLSIACENGHKEIVVLLLASGFTCESNTNGEYPIHHAARNGHSELCELLVSHKGFDIADKFNEWTPLFHAARYGHLACVKSLLQAGANALATDEFNRSPSFYAAWYGHVDVLSTLLAASHGSTSESLRIPGTRQGSHATPSTSSDAAHSIMEEDLDAIPSLSLPPPIMPFRSYGHNYLQSSHLIQICLGRVHPQPSEQTMPVRLIPKLLKRVQEPSAELAVKVVFSCKAETVAGPLSFTLPTTGERPEVMFQIPSLDDLYLEISLHPSVGTKIIGRAIFLPSAFRDIRRKRVFTSPLLDQNLQIIGEVYLFPFSHSPSNSWDSDRL
jgi:CDK inhibitor PHO81